MQKNINWEKLGCEIIPTKTMFISIKKVDSDWDYENFIPYAPIAFSPGAQVLNYGQGIFEGLKAQRTKNNEIVLFRPDANAKRFENSAKDMNMPPYPTNKFVDVIKEIVKKNIDYVPPYSFGSLYIRPCMWGTGEILNVTPAKEYTFLIYTSPVGNYLGKGLESIKLEICTEYQRAATKGTGSIKCIGNYPGAMKYAEAARNKGYRGCIFLDAIENRYIEEAEAANFFCIYKGKLITPKLGTIMPGITRDSIIRIANEILEIEVVEKKLSVEEALNAEECFCSGTLATITPVGVLGLNGEDTIYNNFQPGKLTIKLRDILTKIQLGEIEDKFNWVEKI